MHLDNLQYDKNKVSSVECGEVSLSAVPIIAEVIILVVMEG